MAFILFYIGFYSIAATGAVARTSLLLLLPASCLSVLLFSIPYSNPVDAACATIQILTEKF